MKRRLNVYIHYDTDDISQEQLVNWLSRQMESIKMSQPAQYEWSDGWCNYIVMWPKELTK